MRKVLFVSLAAAVVIGLAGVCISNVFGQPYYSAEDIKVNVKKIDEGVQITVTSDDPEIAKDIQENYRWYRDAFQYGYCQGSRGSGGWRGGYCGGPCSGSFCGRGYSPRCGWR